MAQPEKQKLNTTIVLQMSGNQFPFGQYETNFNNNSWNKKVFVKKRIFYRTVKEKVQLESKLNVLKSICHRNVINIKNVEEVEPQGYTIYYNYVPLSLVNAFQQLDNQTFKQLHKQIIQLAIHLAKNYILTPFNPTRCGGIFVDGKFIIKYYLPLNQIILTDNVSMLERSVQLFKVQAMHMLDTLRHNDVLTELGSFSSEKISMKCKPNSSKGKQSILQIKNKSRKLSSQSFKKRKLLNYNSKNDDLRRKRSHDETNFTDVKLSGLKRTLKSFRVQSERKRTLQKSKQKIKQRIQTIRVRSYNILKKFQVFKKEIAEYRSLARLIKPDRVI